MPRRACQVLALATVLLMTAACQGEVDPRHTPAPGACNHAADTGGDGGDGDGGLGAGFDYSDAHNDFGTAAPMTLCMNIEGPVRVTGTSPRISVDPEIHLGDGPRFTFFVTVAPGGRGHLEIELLNDRGEEAGAFNGPRMSSDDTGWAFVW